MQVKLKKILFAAVPLAGLLFMNSPASAHDDRRGRLHDDRHGAYHDRRGDLHQEFHGHPYSKGEHRRFHRYLKRDHRDFHKDRDWRRDYHDRDWYGGRRYNDDDYYRGGWYGGRRSGDDSYRSRSPGSFYSDQPWWYSFQNR